MRCSAGKINSAVIVTNGLLRLAWRPHVTCQNPSPTEGRTTPSWEPSSRIRVAGRTTPRCMRRQTREPNVPQKAHCSLAWNLCKLQLYPSLEARVQHHLLTNCPFTDHRHSFPGALSISQSLTLSFFDVNHSHSEFGFSERKQTLGVSHLRMRLGQRQLPNQGLQTPSGTVQQNPLRIS